MMVNQMRTSAERSPSFILFVTDQQRADYLGCYGHPVVRTPNIDAIAAKGTRFERFYVASPVCMVNRASLMTGRMPSVHGVRMNGIPLSQQQATFVEVLRSAGYATALVGKSHLQNMVDIAPYVSREARRGRAPAENLAEARRPYPGDYDQELPSRWRSQTPLTVQKPFYGFDHVDLCTGHGDLAGGHYYQWLRKRLADPESVRGPDRALPSNTICPQAWRTSVPENLYPTAYIRDCAVDYLATVGDQPFFLMVSFPDPHHPFTPPGRYWDLYDPDDFPLPRSFDAAERGVAAAQWARAFRQAHPDASGGYGAFSVSEREIREAMALTAGMIAMIDDAIGAVMEAASRHGRSDDTVVMFTSDHGDYLGDYGLLLKSFLHLQGLVRVPFIWSDPANPDAHRRSDAIASTIDIAATILGRAGLQSYNGIQGRNLLPALAGDDIRAWTLVEEDGQQAQFGFDRAPRVRSLITASHRLTLYDGAAQGELVDLANDPDEIHNLWDDPAMGELRPAMMEALARAQMEHAETSPMPRYLA